MPRYESNVLTDKDAPPRPTDPNVLTGNTLIRKPGVAAQGSSQPSFTPRRPLGMDDDLHLRTRAMEMQAQADYQNRMALAKVDDKRDDPQLAATAAAIYQGEIAKVFGYNQEIRNKWRTVDNADQFDNDQKNALKYKILNSSEEPVYIPKPAKPKQGNEIDTILRAAMGGEKAPAMGISASGELPPNLAAIDTLSALREQIQAGRKAKELEKLIEKKGKQGELTTVDEINKLAGYAPVEMGAPQYAGGMPTGTTLRQMPKEALSMKDVGKLKSLSGEDVASIKAILYSGNQEAVRALIAKVKEIK